jgi:hypothetical protein
MYPYLLQLAQLCLLQSPPQQQAELLLSLLVRLDLAREPAAPLLHLLEALDALLADAELELLLALLLQQSARLARAAPQEMVLRLLGNLARLAQAWPALAPAAAPGLLEDWLPLLLHPAPERARAAQPLLLQAVPHAPLAALHACLRTCLQAALQRLAAGGPAFELLSSLAAELVRAAPAFLLPSAFSLMLDFAICDATFARPLLAPSPALPGEDDFETWPELSHFLDGVSSNGGRGGGEKTSLLARLRKGPAERSLVVLRAGEVRTSGDAGAVGRYVGLLEALALAAGGVEQLAAQLSQRLCPPGLPEVPASADAYLDLLPRRPPFERDAWLARQMAAAPLLWAALELVARLAPRECLLLQDVLVPLLANAVADWNAETGPSRDSPRLPAALQLLRVLVQAQWLPAEFGRAAPLLDKLAPSEVSQLFLIAMRFLRDHPPELSRYTPDGRRFPPHSLDTYLRPMRALLRSQIVSLAPYFALLVDSMDTSS